MAAPSLCTSFVILYANLPAKTVFISAIFSPVSFRHIFLDSRRVISVFFFGKNSEKKKVGKEGVVFHV